MNCRKEISFIISLFENREAWEHMQAKTEMRSLLRFDRKILVSRLLSLFLRTRKEWERESGSILMSWQNKCRSGEWQSIEACVTWIPEETRIYVCHSNSVYQMLFSFPTLSLLQIQYRLFQQNRSWSKGTIVVVCHVDFVRESLNPLVTQRQTLSRSLKPFSLLWVGGKQTREM